MRHRSGMPRRQVRRELAPVSGGFTLMALIGFIVSLFATLYGGLDISWGAGLSFLFLLMIIASVISLLPPWPEELKK